MSDRFVIVTVESGTLFVDEDGNEIVEKDDLTQFDAKDPTASHRDLFDDLAFEIRNTL